MKFTPKIASRNYNISSTHPLKEVAWIVGGLLTITILFYFVLGLLVDQVATYLPVKAELWIGNHVQNQLLWDKSPPLQARLEKLIAALPSDSPIRNYPFTVYLDKSKQVNAYALPGGSIVVLKGLLDTVQSENELAMILAHELGHFANRDHLKAMGRGLFLVASAWLISTGNQQSASQFITRIASNIEAKYSQKQENAADTFALKLLNDCYGHTGGATIFFDRLATQTSNSRFAYFLASHPHPADRVSHINVLKSVNGYSVDRVLPLKQDILTLIK